MGHAPPDYPRFFPLVFARFVGVQGETPARGEPGLLGPLALMRIGGVWGRECLSNCLLERGVIPIVSFFINGKRSALEASACLHLEESYEMDALCFGFRFPSG